jgi:hypothetical protein
MPGTASMQIKLSPTCYISAEIRDGNRVVTNPALVRLEAGEPTKLFKLWEAAYSEAMRQMDWDPRTDPTGVGISVREGNYINQIVVKVYGIDDGTHPRLAALTSELYRFFPGLWEFGIVNEERK